MKNHRLYEINLERQIAFCIICGYTEIYVGSIRTRAKPQIICINKYNEQRESIRESYYDNREKKRSRPNWQPRHVLSDIDPSAQTAICAVCGPTDIWKSTVKGSPRYYCATKHREYMREYKRSHYTPRATNPHALTVIDEEKGTAVCAKCGPVRIEIVFGERKIIRRCINASKEVSATKKGRRKAIKNVTPETI